MDDFKTALQSFTMCASDALNTIVGVIVGFAGSGQSHSAILISTLLTTLSGALSMSSGEWLSTNTVGSGNPWTAAVVGFLSFTICSVTPILPYFWMTDNVMIASAFIGAVVLFTVGAIEAKCSEKPIIVSGIRQMLIGMTFAVITYIAGKYLGANISG